MYQNSIAVDANVIKTEKNRGYYKLVNGLLFLFILFAVFMPADNLNLKKLFFVVIVAVCLPIIMKRILKKQNRFLFFMTVVYPIVFILMSIGFFFNSVSRAVQIGHCAIYFFLYFAVCDNKVNFSGIFFKVLQLETVIIIISAVLHFTGILHVLNNQFLQYLWLTDNAMIGVDSKAVLGVLFFIKTTPLLVFLEGYAAYQGNSKWVLLSTIALFCSGTRANSLCALAICAGYFLLKKEKNKMKLIIRGIVIFVAALLIITVFIPIIAEFLTNLSTAKTDNDAWRSSIMMDVFNQFIDNPISLIVGTGFGSPIYTSMYGQYKYILEVSYLDLLRQVGLIGFIPFCYFAFNPIKKLWKMDIWITLGYIAYLAIAATNPLLYSSTGYLAYTFVYLCVDRGEVTNIFQKRRKRIRFKF